MKQCDFLIVGGGISGASAGFWLSKAGSVIVLEQESQPGYHTTGRSAAFFMVSYGNACIRALTIGSRSFFDNTPDEFSDYPLLSPRGAVYIGRADQHAKIEALYNSIVKLSPKVRLVTPEWIVKCIPAVRPDYVSMGVYEPDAMDIDVNALHQGFLRGLKKQGSEVITNAEVVRLKHCQGVWEAETKAGIFAAPVIINAAGAWGDVVAECAGVSPISLTPKRRTLITFKPPPEFTQNFPLVIDVDEEFYFKPESGQILASPCDETPMPPCDIQPDELDIAIAADRIQRATNFSIHRILNKWAGLRTFAPDMTPVVGMDAQAPGFFWLVGQGGYGIQTAPAMGRLACGLLTEGRVPQDLIDLDVSAAILSPDRFRRQA